MDLRPVLRPPAASPARLIPQWWPDLWDGTSYGTSPPSDGSFTQRKKTLFESSLWKADPVYILPQNALPFPALRHETAMPHLWASTQA